MSVQWDPTLALGHAEIDGQHKELFRRFGALVTAMEGGQPDEIRTLFEFLGEYVVKHFAAEEQVMAKTAYPGANVHAAAHARFIREYRELRALFDAVGAPSGVVVKTRTWIDGWLRSHIIGVDQALARHLRDR
ncbi:MAG TPA: hemerythrin family protein [Anaeromyxobacter sp.]